MSMEIIIIFAILGIAVLLFVTEWIRADLVAVLVTVSLAASGILSAGEAFSGFSSSAVIAIASLLVIAAALVRSGVVRWMAGGLQRVVRESRLRLRLVGTVVPGVLSGFINIIATVSVFIPAIHRLSRKSSIDPAKLLLPMSVAGVAGANLTIIGASHNLVVNSLLAASGAETFGFFEFAPLGAVILFLVVVYCLVAGKWLLPGSETVEVVPEAEPSDLLRTYQIGDRLWEVWVRPGSAVSGKTINEVGFGRTYGLGVMVVMRKNIQFSVDTLNFRIEEDDVLALVGHRDRIDALVSDHDGFVVLGQPDLRDEFSWTLFEIVDVVVPPRSPVAGKTLREIQFREKTHLTGLALWREGQSFRTAVGDRPLRPGDGLLLFGERLVVRRFNPEPDFLWLDPPIQEEDPPELRKLGPFALGIMFLVILFAALDLFPVAVAALAGASAMVLIGILTPQGAYQSIDWKTIVIVAGMYPVGLALDKSGAAAEIGMLLTNHAGAFGPMAVMAGIAAISILLTQVMHNAVVAVIMTPVAIQAASAMAVDPKAFAIAVLVGASATFLLPVGHPAVMLVQQPGGYKNRDYVKFGIGLVIIVFAALLLVAPLLWPFAA